MVRDPELGDEGKAIAPSKALAGIGAALPFALSLGCCLLVPFVGAGDPARVADLAQEMGVSFYAIMLVAPFAGILAGALVGVGGLGKPVPTALAIFAGALPWLVGLAGHRYGLYVVEEAVAFADPSMRATLIAVGVSESSGAHLYGAGVASGVLLGTSLGLALAALGQRAPARTMLGAGFAILTLPLLAAGGWLITVSPRAAGTPIAIALGAMVAAGLAAAAVGKDEPKYRSTALSVGAVTAAVLAFVAAASAAATASKIEVFSALATVSPSARMDVIAVAAEEMSPATTVATWGFAIGLLPILAAIGWAAMRGKVSVGKVVGGAATALVLLLVIGLDIYVVRVAPANLAALGTAPWRDHPSFEPAPVNALEDESSDVDVLVLEGSLIPLEVGGPVPIGSGDEAVTARFREIREASRMPPMGEPVPEPRPGILGMLQQIEGTSVLPSPEPSIGIAFDRRTDHASMRRVVEAAEAAGAKSLLWTGIPGGMTRDQREKIAAELPLVGALIEQPSVVRVRLPSSLPPAFVATDPEYYHGTIGPGASEVVLEPRERSSLSSMRLAEGDWGERADYSSEPVAYLLVAEGASVEDVSRIISLASNRGFTPALYFDALPPASPLGDAAAVLGALGDGAEIAGLLGDIDSILGDDGSGTIGLGNLGTVGSGRDDSTGNDGREDGGDRRGDRPQAPMVRQGRHTVTGSLSPEVIRRVIRRHVNEARFCYESQLARDPNLEGRVTISFVISPTGSVASANIASSTMNDSTVESCLVTAVRRWQFPAPDGGGVVRVNYPFDFSAS